MVGKKETQIRKYHSNSLLAQVERNNDLLFLLFLSRLLGVDRVVIYNNSCGPELERLLQVYIEEGFVEMVPWPINNHMIPSHGWLHSESGGDVHYFGQQTTLNECIYRSMERSRYVLLNDIDEIIMPYQHEDLMSLIDMLTKKHPNVRYSTLLLGGAMNLVNGPFLIFVLHNHEVLD